MEKKKVSVEVVLKYDHTKTSRIMEITTDEAGVKNLADWANMKSMVLNIDTQRFVLDSLEIESKPRAIGYFTWDVKTQTTTWHDVNGKPINEPEPMDAEVKLIKTGFYVNQKQVDDLRDLIGRICLQGGDVKRRVSTSAYHIKNTLVWKLEKRQYTPGSITLKQVYDLIYKYIVS